jgi:RHS repeat-associated protein
LSIASTAFDRDNENYKGQVTTEGLGTKDLGFRSLDPAIGRFQAVDPLAEIQITESPYQYAGNNSISNIDLFGLIGDEIDDNDVWDSIEKIADEKMAQNDGDTYQISQLRQSSSRQKSKSMELNEAEADHELTPNSKNESGDISGISDYSKGKGRRRGKRTHVENGYSLYNGKKARRKSGSGNSDSGRDPWFDFVTQREIQDASGPPKALLNLVSNDNDNLADFTHDPYSNVRERNTDDIIDLLIGKSYQRTQTETNLQELRRYLYSNHPANEARALLASSKTGRNDFSFIADLERNVTSITMTSTSDDADFSPKTPINCPTCPSGWDDLINFKPPKSIYDKFAEANKNANDPPSAIPSGNWWEVLEMEKAQGSKINLDRYSITISGLPTLNRHQMTIDELFDYIRLNLNSLIDNHVASFTDYPNNDPAAESDKWNTDNYVGVVKKFRGYLIYPLPFDDLGVVAAEQTPNTWTFSTVFTPETQNHSVSGNRQFGFNDNGDGTYTFFTRGADVATGFIDVAAGETLFEKGDALWKSLINGIVNFVIAHNGSAIANPRVSNRYDLIK